MFVLGGCSWVREASFCFHSHIDVSGLMRMKSGLVKEDIKDRNLQVNDVLPLPLETLAVTVSKRTCMILLLWTGGGLVWFVDPPLPSIASQPLVTELAWDAGGFCTVWGHTHQMMLTHWDCHTGWILSSGLNLTCPTRWKIPAFSCGPGTFLLSLLPLSAFHWSWVKSLCCVLCPVNNLMCNWGSYWWNLISVSVFS